MSKLDKKLANLKISHSKNKKQDARKIRKRLSISEAKNQSPLLLDGVKKPNQCKSTKKDEQEIQSNKNDKNINLNLFASYSMKTKVGLVPFNPNKVNQDRAIIIPNLPNCSNKACLFGTFDGHGENGHDVSSFLVENMNKWYLNNKNWIKNIEKSLMDCFLSSTQDLKKSDVNCTFSGSTGVITIIDENNLYTANVGDSRTILCRKEKGKLIVIPLSFDQKPDDLNEKKRIENKNGRVESCRGPLGELIGPARVWLKNQDLPGLAMSRSFGDDVASSVGVISEPEIIIKKRTKNDQFMVSASDGIWEFLSNEDVCDIVSKYKNDPNKASRVLCKEATKKWQIEEDVIDDITCVVVWF